MTDKNVLPLELPKLIRDILIIIDDAREHTIKSVNQKLAQMGWQEEVLDTYTFELILEFIETESDYRVVHHSVH
jgi:hypothetical protein